MGGELDRINLAADAIMRSCRAFPKVAVVLGSGLGKLAEFVESPVAIPYSDIPGFPRPTIAGHAGKLIAGRIGGRDVAVMSGRAHYYEGNDLADVVRPVRTLARLGVKKLVISNAAGALTKALVPGDLMLIVDHINLLGANPLRGANIDELGPRFPSMSFPYDPEMLALAERIAAEQGARLKKGVYLAAQGPSYETPAEIRMMRLMGADAVGMSTVPEVIAANHCGTRVLGVSCITNLASGISDRPLSHDEVLETGAGAADRFCRLITGSVAGL
jgi:purine-nucleoside phosphorylase